MLEPVHEYSVVIREHHLVEADVEDQYVAMFAEMWPKALAALKQVAEGQGSTRSTPGLRAARSSRATPPSAG